MEIARAVAVNRELCKAARTDGIPVRMYLSMAFGSPQEATPMPAVLALIETFADEEVDLLMLADTVGIGTPAQTRALVHEALKVLPSARLGLHMHDTYGHALENCAMGFELGLRAFDASAGGTGGCPFAPGAAGNLATGALLAWADRHGVPHGMDPAAVDAAARYLADLLGRPLAQGAQRGRRKE